MTYECKFLNVKLKLIVKFNIAMNAMVRVKRKL